MHKGKPVSDLAFNPFLSKVVEMLENQHLGHEHRINGLGPMLLFPFLPGMHPCHIRKKCIPLYPAFSSTKGSPISVSSVLRVCMSKNSGWWRADIVFDAHRVDAAIFLEKASRCSKTEEKSGKFLRLP